MKNLAVFIGVAFGIVALLTSAFRPNPQSDEDGGVLGRITRLEKAEWELGDICYSVLPLELFSKTHGAGWALLDGQLPGDSKLKKLLGVPRFHPEWEMPDARGLFLRGVDSRKPHDSTIGNPAGRLPIGSYQDSCVNYQGEVMKKNGGGDWVLNSIQQRPGAKGNNLEISPNNSAGAASTEVRPRCVTVNIFVRIN